jgi:hypothetical protein
MEGHYGLPFLSWLPKPIANKYLQLTCRGTVYYENHLSYFQLRQLMKDFIAMDYTIKIVKDPKRFGAEDMIRPDSIICKIPVFILKGLILLIPTYIFILTKPESGEIKPDACCN